MHRSALYLLASFVLIAVGEPSLGAQAPLAGDSVVRFATVDQGRRLLAASDEFVQRTSPFDRAARLKSAEDVSIEQYLEFVGQNVTEWSDAERARVEQALAAIRPRLEELAVPLPAEVWLIRTTGREEGGAFYTRGAAVVLPTRRLASVSDEELQRTLAHELFHILSRSQPALKQRLYAAIGFVPCGEVELPASLADRRITNPDAPRIDHAIELTVDGQPRWAVPVLYSRSPQYDPRQGGEFFQYLEFRLMAIDRPASGAAAATLVEGEPVLFAPDEVEGFFPQIGRNTHEIMVEAAAAR
ncbi:MAG TPA: hypothetical protein PJ982_06845, partial [Lacipirellulaceae bacterium]|nr:hypothetical protein [Lacipirellulaceae bacterium]